MYTRKTTYTVRKEQDERGYFYTLEIRRGKEVCLLPDISRHLRRARQIAAWYRRGQVGPESAAEVTEELLARDPNWFC